jgi:hypothetical protein
VDLEKRTGLRESRGNLIAKFIDDHWKIGGVIVLLAAIVLEVKSLVSVLFIRGPGDVASNMGLSGNSYPT